MAQVNPNRQLVDDAVALSRIPDTIKLIPAYSGDTKDLESWISTVENVLALYVELANTPTYQVWILTVRNKLVGKASDALNNSHTPLDWNSIKETLISHFGDRRDLSTLTQKIPYISQNNKTIDEFYQECVTIQSNINSKIRLDPTHAGHYDNIMMVMSNMIKDAFIDGLNEPYSSYTRNYRPTSLTDAYSCVREQYSANERKKAKSTNSQMRMTQKIGLNGPAMMNVPRYNSYRPPFIPQRPNLPRPINYQTRPFNQQQRPHNFQPRPFNFQPRPFNIQPRPFNSQPGQWTPHKSFENPTPMDVDRSLRSRQANGFINNNEFYWPEEAYWNNEQNFTQEYFSNEEGNCNQGQIDDLTDILPIEPTPSDPNIASDDLNFWSAGITDPPT